MPPPMVSSADLDSILTTDSIDQGESAGTALVLAAFYRYAVIAPNAVD